jgi:hypothetical protein
MPSYRRSNSDYHNQSDPRAVWEQPPGPLTIWRRRLVRDWLYMALICMITLIPAVYVFGDGKGW